MKSKLFSRTNETFKGKEGKRCLEPSSPSNCFLQDSLPREEERKQPPLPRPSVNLLDPTLNVTLWVFWWCYLYSHQLAQGCFVWDSPCCSFYFSRRLNFLFCIRRVIIFEALLVMKSPSLTLPFYINSSR